jgi:hypothetical protein
MLLLMLHTGGWNSSVAFVGAQVGLPNLGVWETSPTGTFIVRTT